MDNELDIAIEIALFEPDEDWGGVRANAAGTKVIFSRHNGTSRTCWARDFTLSASSRAAAIALLHAAYLPENGGE